MASTTPALPDAAVAVKISYNGATKKFKLHLADLTPTNLVPKLRFILDIPSDRAITFERFSDSNGSYMSLDPTNQSNYKSLHRAAKAKGKLRLKATDQVLPVPTHPLDLPDPIMPTRLTLRQKQTAKTLFEPVNPANRSVLNDVTGGVRVAAASSTPSVKRAVEEPTSMVKLDNRRSQFFNDLASPNVQHATALRPRQPAPAPAAQCTWSVYCNDCGGPVPDEHFHCTNCDDGDYDLCSKCVADGKHCKNNDHWLIKRTIVNGQVVNSTTHRVAPKSEAVEDAKTTATPPLDTEKMMMPGAFAQEQKTEAAPVLAAFVPDMVEASRTCNSCVKVLPSTSFMHCQSCEDFDLCVPCLTGNKHGHHPGHAFKPVVEGTNVGQHAEYVATAGRNVRHAAICDNCNVNIYGVRHKCLNCPDWDYCSKCIAHAHVNHPGHRFTTIYEPLPETYPHAPRHFGIYCDGPLCIGSKSYVQGVRYKCAICHDLDFCANCEAAPQNKHNRTHPLIKFRTPVKNVSVTTLGEDQHGLVKTTMGDNLPQKEDSRPSSIVSANGLSKVQPILDVKPAEQLPTKMTKTPKEKIEIKNLLAEPIHEKVSVQDMMSHRPTPGPELNAYFLRDAVPDGTKMLAGRRFIQTWALRNPGPLAWPAGCAVCYVGGDSMKDNDSVAQSNKIGRAVGVGEEVHFSVFLKAREKEGTCISYWRLKTPTGLPFGHRLWCHIESVTHVEIAKMSAVMPADHSFPRDHVLTDFQMQLMLLEQQNKRRMLMARQKEEDKASGTAAQQQMGSGANVQAERQMMFMREQADMRAKLQARQHEVHVANSPRQQELLRQRQAQHAQMLRALHAARLAAISASKQEAAASMNFAIPAKFQPTVEDAEEKEHSEAGPAYSARDIRSYMPSRPSDTASPPSPPAPPAPPAILTAGEREALSRQIEARRFARNSCIVPREELSAEPAVNDAHGEAISASREQRVSSLKAMLVQINAQKLTEEANVLVLSKKNAELEAQLQQSQEKVELPAEALVNVGTEPHIKAVAGVGPRIEHDVVEQKSTMIFPKLDKESPASSTHEAAFATMVPSSPAVTAVTATETMGSPRTDLPSLFDDAESVELFDASSDGSSDDGFLTDEEYDVLGASDEEFA